MARTGMFKVEVKGLNTLLKKADMATASQTLRKGMKASGIFISGWIKDNRLSGARPQYLGVVSGRLRSSIKPSRAVKRGGEIKLTIGTNVKYGEKHEKGLYGMKKRPFLRPGIEEPDNKKEVLRIMTLTINEAIRAAR